MSGVVTAPAGTSRAVGPPPRTTRQTPKRPRGRGRSPLAVTVRTKEERVRELARPVRRSDGERRLVRRTGDARGRRPVLRDLPSVRGRGLAAPAVQPQGAAREPPAYRGRPRHHRGQHPRAGGLGPDGRARHRDPVRPRPRRDAGLHRCPVHRRPRHHARGRHRARGRRPERQPARARRAGHRPLRRRRPLRHARRVRAQRGAGVPAQRGALQVPALGPDRVQRVQGRPARHRHRPPGQHRAPGARGHDPQRSGLPRHPRRHRLAHHDGQRPRRAGLGRRRHRGRGGHARPARLDAHPQGRRLPALRRAAPGRHRHRPGPDDHRDAARARRRREVRRVLRRGRRRRAAGQPRHDRQHEPRVRLDVRDLPDRRRDAELPALHRPRRRPGRPRRGLLQGAGPLARPVAHPGLLRDALAGPLHGRAVDRRPEAPAGPHRARRRQGVVPRRAARLRRRRRARRAASPRSPTASPSRPPTRPPSTPTATPTARGSTASRSTRTAGRPSRCR